MVQYTCVQDKHRNKTDTLSEI